MKQAIKPGVTQSSSKKTKTNKPRRKSTNKQTHRNHPKYGTSKLEVKFQKEFLDRVGLQYIYQYELKSIGRYLDFMLVDNIDCPVMMVGVEIDGDFYHSYGLTFEEMNPMQKRNLRVDNIKNKWFEKNHIPLVRIWENEIHKEPQKVLTLLREIKEKFDHGDGDQKRRVLESKKIRH